MEFSKQMAIGDALRKKVWGARAFSSKQKHMKWCPLEIASEKPVRLEEPLCAHLLGEVAGENDDVMTHHQGHCCSQGKLLDLLSLM